MPQHKRVIQVVEGQSGKLTRGEKAEERNQIADERLAELHVADNSSRLWNCERTEDSTEDLAGNILSIYSLFDTTTRRAMHSTCSSPLTVLFGHVAWGGPFGECAKRGHRPCHWTVSLRVRSDNVRPVGLTLCVRELESLKR